MTPPCESEFEKDEEASSASPTSASAFPEEDADLNLRLGSFRDVRRACERWLMKHDEAYRDYKVRHFNAR